MILPEDVMPNKSLYVIGSRIIEILKTHPHDYIEPKTLFDKYVARFPEARVSYNYFVYAIDWLFLIKAVDIGRNNSLQKCF